MNVAWGLFWGGSRSAKLCAFRVKWVQPTMQGSSCVTRVRAGIVLMFFFVLPQCNGGFKLLWMRLCVCIVIGCFGICGCWSQWNGCMIVVVFCCHVRTYMIIHAGLWRGAAKHIVMAASWFLAAAAACVILLSFAREESYWSGRIRVARVICHQIFSILALVIFLSKLILKRASKSALAPRPGFGAATSVVVMYKQASRCKNFLLSVRNNCA